MCDNIDESRNVSDINQRHSDGYTDNELGVVALVDWCRTLYYIPQNIHKFFPNFFGLILEYNEISDLHGDELCKYKHLQYFILSNNYIRNIPKNFFSHNPHLRHLSLYNNRIKTVGSDFPRLIRGIKSINLSGNCCIEDIADKPHKKVELSNEVQKYCVVTKSTTLEEVNTRCRDYYQQCCFTDIYE